MSSIWVRTKSYLWRNNEEWPEEISPEVRWPKEALPLTGSMLCASGSFAMPLVGPFHRKWRQWSCAHAQPVHGYLWPKGWKGVRMPNRKLRNIPLVGPFHRKLATGSSFFPRNFHISSTKCWLGCSLRRPRLPLSLVIGPFYFHNYI